MTTNTNNTTSRINDKLCFALSAVWAAFQHCSAAIPFWHDEPFVFTVAHVDQILTDELNG